MMIASSSTIQALAVLATLVVSGGAANTIRGNSGIKQQQPRAEDDAASVAARDLVEIDMNMGLGEMVCKEHPSDQSVVCTFRTMPPADLTTGMLMHDCIYSPTSNYCLSTELKRVPYSDVPATSMVVVSPINDSEPDEIEVNINPVGSVGTCPARIQVTGMGCSQFIPFGATATRCTYGQTICTCALQDNNPAIAVGWSCSMVQQQSPPVTRPAPVSVPVDMFKCRPKNARCTAPHTIESDCSGMPSCCPGNIFEDWRTTRNTCVHNSDSNTGNTVNTGNNINSINNSNLDITAEINTVTTGRVDNASSVNTGQILPNIINQDFCSPTMYEEGDNVSCEIGQRCQYYVYNNWGQRVSAKNCDCNSYRVFQCRTANNVQFSF